MTIEQIKLDCLNAGFKVSSASWEDDRNIYVFSVECSSTCLGHPMWTGHFNKNTRWLDITGRKAVKI